MMRIQTFSILAGSEACNARCPFCVSAMTPPQGMTLKEPQVNWRNFRKACIVAARAACTTAMLTGKGEPCLFPDQITKYLTVLKEFERDFPMVELQTNGLSIFENKNDTFWWSAITDTHADEDAGYLVKQVDGKLHSLRGHLADWYKLGLTTVIISIVHYDRAMNHKVYTPHRSTEYMDLPFLIEILHRWGFSVRLGCIGLDGFIDSGEKLANLIEFAKANKVEQLTYRPVNAPETTMNTDVAKWTRDHFLKREQREDIEAFVAQRGKLLPINLVHGAKVYDIFGQNLCLTNCLTRDAEPDGSLRQMIFFPDGKLRYDWELQGAILL